MSRLGVVIPTLAMLAACEDPINLAGQALPQAELSTSRLDFGALEWGETEYRRVSITNRGALPLGISSIAIGTNEMEQNFALHLAPSVDCDGTAPTDDGTDGDADGGEAEDEGPSEGDTGIDINDGHTDDAGEGNNALGATVLSLAAGLPDLISVVVLCGRPGMEQISCTTARAVSPRGYLSPNSCAVGSGTPCDS